MVDVLRPTRGELFVGETMDDGWWYEIIIWQAGGHISAVDLRTGYPTEQAALSAALAAYPRLYSAQQ